jgi:hypothetical protein
VEFSLQQSSSAINLSLAMTSGKVVLDHLASNRQFFVDNQSMVSGQKIPRPSNFELTTTTIPPHHMAVWKTTHVL